MTETFCCFCRFKSIKSNVSLLASILENVSKLNQLQFRRILENVLEKFIYYINPELEKYQVKNEVRAAPNFTDREKNMLNSFHVLLKYFYKRDPRKVNMDDVTNPSNIITFLTKNLIEIEKTHKKIAENPFNIVLGKASNQKLVLNCLLFAAKLILECMEKANDNQMEIFNNVINTVIEFFDEKNILAWIQHSIQETDPFGKIFDDCENSLNENET